MWQLWSELSVGLKYAPSGVIGNAVVLLCALPMVAHQVVVNMCRYRHPEHGILSLIEGGAAINFGCGPRMPIDPPY